MNEFDEQWKRAQRAWFIVDMIVLLACAAFIGYCVWAMILQ